MSVLVEAASGLAYGLASALVPLINAEAYAVVAGRHGGHAPVVVLALALGQTAGKLLLFESARRGLTQSPIDPTANARHRNTWARVVHVVGLSGRAETAPTGPHRHSLNAFIRKQYGIRMTRTIDLPDELDAALKEIAVAEHRSVQQTLVVAAQEYVERQKLRGRVRASGRQIIQQDRELLHRRLAQ